MFERSKPDPPAAPIQPGLRQYVEADIIPRYDENDTISIAFNENKFDLDEVLNKIVR